MRPHLGSYGRNSSSCLKPASKRMVLDGFGLLGSLVKHVPHLATSCGSLSTGREVGWRQESSAALVAPEINARDLMPKKMLQLCLSLL